MRTEFDCTIPRARRWHRRDSHIASNTALAKIGTSVCFEASGRALRLRTWNDAKTAFLVFVFENSFGVVRAAGRPAQSKSSALLLIP